MSSFVRVITILRLPIDIYQYVDWQKANGTAKKTNR